MFPDAHARAGEELRAIREGHDEPGGDRYAEGGDIRLIVLVDRLVVVVVGLIEVGDGVVSPTSRAKFLLSLWPAATPMEKTVSGISVSSSGTNTPSRRVS